MKKIFLMMSLVVSMTAFADIEELPGDKTNASASEIESSRSCFQEVESFGCGHPREGQEKFRDCMSNVHQSLKASCQKMMTELYGTK